MKVVGIQGTTMDIDLGAGNGAGPVLTTGTAAADAININTKD